MFGSSIRGNERIWAETVSRFTQMLVLILQFVEGLSDWHPANAVRLRIDWKYLLCLELADPRFDYSVLNEFRMEPHINKIMNFSLAVDAPAML